MLNTWNFVCRLEYGFYSAHRFVHVTLWVEILGT